MDSRRVAQEIYVDDLYPMGGESVGGGEVGEHFFAFYGFVEVYAFVDDFFADLVVEGDVAVEDEDEDKDNGIGNKYDCIVVLIGYKSIEDAGCYAHKEVAHLLDRYDHVRYRMIEKMQRARMQSPALSVQC